MQNGDGIFPLGLVTGKMAALIQIYHAIVDAPHLRLMIRSSDRNIIMYMNWESDSYLSRAVVTVYFCILLIIVLIYCIIFIR